MNGIDLLICVGGVTLIAIAFWVRQWETQVEESRQRHEDNRRHWRVIDRIEAYGYRSRLLSVDDLIDDVLKEAA